MKTVEEEKQLLQHVLFECDCLQAQLLLSVDVGKGACC